ncbi:MAG TPA: metal ABC transporter substrate-binding protein [Dehalococcoidales bacterium]|nr:metal ABC transporter substrate-binding protein [Dehalococcoidales bacterium]
MKAKFTVLLALVLLSISAFLFSCAPAATTSGKKSIVVTYSILGSLVKELVGGEAVVTVSIPNGLDPHEWEPSAKDISAINKADLVIENGLGLEGGMQKTLQAARSKGVKFFTASDYITVRHVGQGEGIPSGDPDQAIGAEDPHLWMDPLDMKSIVGALAPVLLKDLNLDVTSQATDLENRLDSLNKEVASMVAGIPQDNRKLVTGHESMGYFAQRYGFKLVGAIIPSISSQAEVSAADLAALKKLIQDNQVKAIFTELGTSPVVAKAIGDETGVKVVELTTHALPSDGSYFTFLRNIASVITNGLK